MPAAKTPPMIAPGVLCPKCKGPMLDERATKRTDKSPDYTCANMLCTSSDGKYRTAIWIKDVVGVVPADAVAPANGKPPVSGAPVDPPDPETVRAQKAKYCVAMKHAVQYVLENIEPLYRAKEIGLSGDDAYKHAYSIFRSWDDAGLIQ